MFKNIFSALVIGFILFTSINAQNDSSIKEGAPKIFIDCGYCDQNFIKEQIPIVNYVRDRKDADVHVLYTSQRTGSSGQDYTLYFIGQNEYEKIKDTIKYTTFGTDSEDQSRTKMVKALKLGLVKFIAKSKIAEQMSITYKAVQTNPTSTQKEEDPWNYWLFRVSANGYSNGEKNYKSMDIGTTVSANRTTEDLKLSISLSNNYSESLYKFSTPRGEESYLNITRSQYANASMIKAIDNNWSWGIWLNANSSTYNNINFSMAAAPGIEYNIFPYSESNQRQLRISYKLSSIFSKYVEETYYFKTKENLFRHELDASLSLVKPWGNISFGADVSNYLDDFENYSYGIYTSSNLRLFKGFSLNFSVGYNVIGKQVTLPLIGATKDEVLLRRRQLETNYNYYGFFGISYSFGSIFNNAVNPRFGGSGGTTMIISN